MTDDAPPAGLPDLIEHLAATQRNRLRNALQHAGFAWHGTAAGDLLCLIDTPVIAQTELTRRSGLSKQAVQQLLDQLEAQGALIREPDPADRRARRLRLTARGEADLAARTNLRAQLDDEARLLLGRKAHKKLRKSLRALAHPQQIAAS